MNKTKHPNQAGSKVGADLLVEADTNIMFHSTILTPLMQVIKNKKLRYELFILSLLLSRQEDRLIGVDDPKAHRQVDCILFLKESIGGC